VVFFKVVRELFNLKIAGVVVVSNEVVAASITASEQLQWCSICDPAKIFFILQFSYLLFCNPTHKSETGKAKNVGGLLIANHLDQSL
jgi:hypothetical protein